MDTIGLLINLVVTPGDVQDRHMIAPRDGKAQSVQPSVGFYFSETPPSLIKLHTRPWPACIAQT